MVEVFLPFPGRRGKIDENSLTSHAIEGPSGERQSERESEAVIDYVLNFFRFLKKKKKKKSLFPLKRQKQRSFGWTDRSLFYSPILRRRAVPRIRQLVSWTHCKSVTASGL